jgi:glutaredoxin
MITVTLYSRSDCHLCEVAKEDLDELREQYPHELVLIDVDSADLKRLRVRSAGGRNRPHILRADQPAELQMTSQPPPTGTITLNPFRIPPCGKRANVPKPGPRQMELLIGSPGITLDFLTSSS